MKKIILLSFFISFLFRFKAQQAPTMETYTLKNGLKIYLMKYGKIEAMYLSIIINSGKKNETPGQQGYNGIVANLVLQGNSKFDEEQQNDKAFAIGAELSTSSNFDNTRISSNFLSKDANTVFEMMSAAIQQPLFKKEKVDQHISYLINYNNPTKMDIGGMAQIYSNLSLYGLESPLGRSIYKNQLKLITPEKLKEFHQFNYTPKNTKIVVCGNFDSNEIKKLVEIYFGNWQSTYGEVNGVALEEPQIKNKEYYFVNRSGATQSALEWNKPAPSVKDKNAIGFYVANLLFNQALFKEIREIGGKTYAIGSSHQTSQFSNLMSIGCSVRNSELYNTVVLFDKTLAKFNSEPIKQQDFENEIVRYKTHVLSLEFPDEIVEFYDPVKHDFSKQLNHVNELGKLKLEDVQKIIKKYFSPDAYKLVIAGDEVVVGPQLEKIKNLKKYSPADLEYKK